VKTGLVVLTAFSAVALGTVLEPAVFVGSAAWRPSRLPVSAPMTQALPLSGTQFLTVQPGDTIAMTTSSSSGPEGACFKAIGNSRIVTLACNGPRGYHVFLRAYHGKITPSNATLGDTLALSLPAPLATAATACDTALANAGIRGDSTISARPAPCPP
jgi:hypothetical protein